MIGRLGILLMVICILNSSPSTNHVLESSKKDRVVVVLKVDVIARGILGRLISRFEEKGLRLIASRFILMDEQKIARLYHQRITRSFYPLIQKYLRNGPIFASIWEGRNLMERLIEFKKGSKVTRENLLSDGNRVEGGLRGMFGHSYTQNSVHITDEPKDYEIEASIFFDLQDLPVQR